MTTRDFSSSARRPTGRSQFLTLDFSGGVLTVLLAGPGIGQREAPLIADEVTRALTSGGFRLRALILDFSEVRVLSSMGLGMCIDLRHRAHEVGVKTIVHALSSELEELFQMMKIDRLCIISRNRKQLDRALAA